MDTLGHLLAAHVTPASEQGRAQVAELSAQVQDMELEVIRLPGAKRGFVPLARRWVVERSLAWSARLRRLAKDYERLPETLAGLYLVTFAIIMLVRVAALLKSA